MLDENFYNELIAFIESGSVLEVSKPKLDIGISNIMFVDDFEEAEELAIQQESEHCELSWVELKAEKIMGVLNDARQKDQALYKFVKKDLEKYREKFSRAFYKRKLKNKLNSYAVEAVSEISPDLFDILVDHTVYGDNSHFYKMLFQMYKSGLWPCGWKGDLPNDDCSNGTWIVYKPSLD